MPDKNNRERVASSKSKRSEKVFITQDASLGNTLISEIPILGRKFEGLLSLQPAVTSKGFVSEGRADQANVAIDGIKGGSPNGDFLAPWNIRSGGETTTHISRSLSWIRFEIILEKPLTREDCRVVIKTADGRSVTSVDWSEPLTPNQTIIDTPFLATGDLSSGDYVLLLLGKDPDGSFVKVAEYNFKVIKQ